MEIFLTILVTCVVLYFFGTLIAATAFACFAFACYLASLPFVAVIWLFEAYATLVRSTVAYVGRLFGRKPAEPEIEPEKSDVELEPQLWDADGNVTSWGMRQYEVEPEIDPIETPYLRRFRGRKL